MACVRGPLIAPDKSLRVVKQPITPLAPLMLTPDNIAKTEFQWSKLSFVDWENKNNGAVNFLTEVAEHTDASGEQPLKELSDLAFKLLFTLV